MIEPLGGLRNWGDLSFRRLFLEIGVDVAAKAPPNQFARKSDC